MAARQTTKQRRTWGSQEDLKCSRKQRCSPIWKLWTDEVLRVLDQYEAAHLHLSLQLAFLLCQNQLPHLSPLLNKIVNKAGMKIRQNRQIYRLAKFSFQKNLLLTWALLSSANLNCLQFQFGKAGDLQVEN